MQESLNSSPGGFQLPLRSCCRGQNELQGEFRAQGFKNSDTIWKLGFNLTLTASPLSALNFSDEEETSAQLPGKPLQSVLVMMRSNVHFAFLLAGRWQLLNAFKNLANQLSQFRDLTLGGKEAVFAEKAAYIAWHISLATQGKADVLKKGEEPNNGKGNQARPVGWVGLQGGV